MRSHLIKDSTSKPCVELLCDAGNALLRCVVLAAVAASGAVLLWQSQSWVGLVPSGQFAEQLVLAATVGDHAAWSDALARGTPVDSRNDMGSTALTLAASRGDVELAARLIDAGADVEAVCDVGMTPLAMAALNGHVEMIRLLIDAGADVNQPGRRGNSALHAAASQCHAEAVKLLIRSGAAVNARNDDGLTPLMVLTYVGDALPELAMTLIDAGTDLCIESNDGDTVLEIAEGEGRTDLQGLYLTSSMSRTSRP